ncbi:MAG: hypothetical protein IKW08_08725, partial [Roseburia sp.]|nr:hypothetical protein [Roseburia sp.]
MRNKKIIATILAFAMIFTSIQFPTVQVKAEENTANVNHVRTATMSASSVEDDSPTLAADKANDGNNGTWWSSASATVSNPAEWLKAEFA